MAVDRALAHFDRPNEQRERVALFDYDPLTDDGGIWIGTLPLADIYEHGAADCRITFDMDAARKVGAVVFGLVGAVLFMILSLPAIPISQGGFLGAIPGAAIGGLLGWWQGHRLAPKPFSLYRRVWTLVDPEEIGIPDEPNALQGEADLITGEMVRQTVSPLGLPQFWYLKIYPLEYTLLQGEDPIDEPVVSRTSEIAMKGTEEGGDDLAFDPGMIRATTMWEVMQQRIDKAQWGTRIKDTWEKIQVGTAVLLAVGVVFLTVFVMIATEK